MKATNAGFNIYSTSICTWRRKKEERFLVTREASGVPRNFVRGGGGIQQIPLRTEDRQNGYLGTVAP